jgi:hypothetical protein
MTRREAIRAIAAGGGVLSVGLAGGYFLRDLVRSAHRAIRGSTGAGMSGRMMGGEMMGSATAADMSTYMELFDRHRELRRRVELIPGGVRTITESNSPELAAKLQAHVASMYAHLQQGAEVTCMSASLPILFRNATRYRRTLTITPKGVAVTETGRDPRVAGAIRAHAREVSGFVREGMPAMMRSTSG